MESEAHTPRPALGERKQEETPNANRTRSEEELVINPNPVALDVVLGAPPKKNQGTSGPLQGVGGKGGIIHIVLRLLGYR